MATACGEVVSIAIDGGEYFPNALLSLDRLTASAICRALRQIQDTEKLMFWLRDHGALGGKHPAAALNAGTPIDQVIAVAQAWARERTEGSSPKDGRPNSMGA